MIVLVIVAGLLVGGAVGGLVRRRSGGPLETPGRSIDSSSAGAHAGFTNQGPQSVG